MLPTVLGRGWLRRGVRTKELLVLGEGIAEHAAMAATAAA